MSTSVFEISPFLFQQIADAVSEGIVVLDRDGHLIHFNAGCESLLGRTPLDSPLERWPEELALFLMDGQTQLPANRLPIAQVLKGDEPEAVNVRVRLPSGEARALRLSAAALQADHGPPQGAYMIINPSGTSGISAESLAESLPDPMFLVQESGLIADVNEVACIAFGDERGELVGLNVRDVLPEFASPEWADLLRSSAPRVNRRKTTLLRKSPGLTRVEISVKPIGRRPGLWCVIAHDLTTSWDLNRDLLQETVTNTFYDPLTQLSNGVLLTDRLRHGVERAKRCTEYVMAVLVLGLDRFKVINDTYGHQVGDQVLSSIGVRLQHGVRARDTVARLTGDAFAVLLDDIDDVNEATCTALRLQKDIEQPFTVSGHEIYTSSSVGIALTGAHRSRPDDLLHDAETAMYRAKAEGKARHQVFDRKIHTEVRTRMDLEADLHRAIERDEFFVYFQPIVNLSNHEIRGFEALVRWNHPTRGFLSPADFIPIAEESELIVPIDRLVLKKACRQLLTLQGSLDWPRSLSLSVNFSGKQFSHPDLVDHVTSILEETKFPAARLKIEITESVIMRDRESVITLLQRLRDLGIELQIDDFGTGYSSLDYLHSMPVNALKIDRSFVSGMDGRNRNFEIVRTIVTLAQNLGLEVVAEGIETEQQLEALTSLNCELGQGYLFAPPIQADKALRPLSEQTDKT